MQHELTRDGQQQAGTPSQAAPERHRLPIVARAATAAFGFGRVHRRAGRERVLSAAEIREWAGLLRRWQAGGGGGTGDWIGDTVDPPLEGPIYFLWGTDHEDQCVVNAKALRDERGEQAFDWQEHLRAVASRHKAGLGKFLAQGKEEQEQRRRSDGGTGDTEDPPGRTGRGRGTSGQGQMFDPAAPSSTAPEAVDAVGETGPAAAIPSPAAPSRLPAAGAAAEPPTAAAAVEPAARTVPHAREAAYLRFLTSQQGQFTDAATEQHVDPSVFQSLPAEIRAELVCAWWDKRPDVVEAKKWAAALAGSARNGSGGQKRRRPSSILDFIGT